MLTSLPLIRSLTQTDSLISIQYSHSCTHSLSQSVPPLVTFSTWRKGKGWGRVGWEWRSEGGLASIECVCLRIHTFILPDFHSPPPPPPSLYRRLRCSPDYPGVQWGSLVFREVTGPSCKVVPSDVGPDNPVHEPSHAYTILQSQSPHTWPIK